MQDPHFIAHKTYLKDLEAVANSSPLLSPGVGKATRLRSNKTAVLLTVFLVCATVFPFAI